MVDLGLKAGTSERQIKDRLQYDPDVFEFFTDENDFTPDGLKRLAYDIEWVMCEATAKIVLHHPMKYQGQATELVAPESKCPQLYSFIERTSLYLLQFAFDYNIQLLLHGAYARQTDHFISMYPSVEKANEALFKRLDHFKELGQDHIMFENSISALFSYGEPASEKEILAHNYRLAFDTSHCFIKVHGSNQALINSLKNLRSDVVHYHLVDSKGKKHDGLPLGQGYIDWAKVMPCLNPAATNIFEIQLPDQNDGREQVDSYNYLRELRR